MLEKRVWGLEFPLVPVELRSPGMSGSSRGLGVGPAGNSQAPEQNWQLGSRSTEEGCGPRRGCPPGGHCLSWDLPAQTPSTAPERILLWEEVGGCKGGSPRGVGTRDRGVGTRDRALGVGRDFL